MSSTSELREPISAVVGADTGRAPIRLQHIVGAWLMLSDYGDIARRHMAIVWTAVLGCGLTDLILLSGSRLSFAPSNWLVLSKVLFLCLAIAIFANLARVRIQQDGRWPARTLRAALRTIELLSLLGLAISLLQISGVSLTYLITSADLPLRDELLARIDHALGFDWLWLLERTNSNAFLAALLVKIYLGPVQAMVFVWLAVTQRGERLAELLAVLALCMIGVCLGMWVIPAAGASVYYAPAPWLFQNFSALGPLWPFDHDFMMLRDGSLSVIDVTRLQGVVSFPSFHTVIAVITIYAVRDTLWLVVPILLVNAIMIVSTLPVGGHYLTDVLAGAFLSLAAIGIVGLQKLGSIRSRPDPI